MGQVTRDPALNVCVPRLAQDVATEDSAGLYLGCLQPLDQFPFRNSIFYSDGETKPGRLRAGIQSRKGNKILIRLQRLIEPQKILPTFLHKSLNSVSLHDTYGGLEIGRFKIVPNVGIDIFVIVSFRETPQLPTKTFRTGIGLTRRAPAVPSPITQGAGDLGKPCLVHDNPTPLTHSNVMGREKTQGPDITEGSD